MNHDIDAACKQYANKLINNDYYYFDSKSQFSRFILRMDNFVITSQKCPQFLLQGESVINDCYSKKSANFHISCCFYFYFLTIQTKGNLN